MSSITVELKPEQLVKLQTLAEQLGTSVESLARLTIEDLLVGHDEKFERAAEYVLRKNAELYRRLA
jgi:predicted transcriptional regulator